MNRTRIVTGLMLLGSVMSLHATDSEKINVDKTEKELTNYLRERTYYGVSPFLLKKRIEGFVESNDIPKQTFLVTVKKTAEEFLIIQTLPDGRKVTARGDNGVGGVTLIDVMGELGNPEFLEWLEKHSFDPEWSGVRLHAARAYVKIAGLDAVPFVKKILSEEREDDFNCKYLTTKELFGQIEQAENKGGGQQEKIDVAFKMLVEQAQVIREMDGAWELDDMLCKALSSYQKSIQREQALSRFLNSANEISRGHFRQEHDKLQKTPKAERIDLRTRFPSLAALEVLEDASSTDGK